MTNITHSVHDNKDDTYSVTIKLGDLVVSELRNIDYFEVETVIKLAEDMYKYGYDDGYEEGKDDFY